MAIEKRGNIWWCDFVVKGERHRYSLGTSDKKVAKQRHDKLKAEKWDLAKEPQRHTFEDAVEIWLSAGQRDMADRYRIRAFKLAGYKLNEITEEVLSNTLAAYQGATRNRCINLITAILNCAVNRKWIPAVPHMERVKVPKGRTRWLTYQEWDALQAELPPHMLQMARFAIATGLRENNVIGLRWNQVDMQRRVAWIHADEAKGGEAIGIPLSDDAIQMLKEQIGKHDHYVFVYERARKPTADDPDAKGKVGKPVTKTSTKAWKAALVRAGIDVVERDVKDKNGEPLLTSTFRWHDLRHTWASWHVMNGTPLEVLQKLGGWKTLQMVLRYAHLAPEHLASYANNSRHKNPPHMPLEASNGAEV
jgi:integrase